MRKTIFIDRDGVINKDPGGWTEHNYVTRWEDFHFLPNSIKAMKKLNEAGYGIVIVSNQAGVNKGYYTKEKLNEINQRMLGEMEKNGVKVKKVYYCVHQDSDDCDCRKPKTGLFKQAEKELGVTAAGNFFIGDGKMDVEAGAGMGMRTILVLSGKTNLEKIRDWDLKPNYIFDDLQEATEFILKGEKI
ncbi:MAG: HAD family hydrolase [Candidatus Omnitrophota bacterium]